MLGIPAEYHKMAKYGVLGIVAVLVICILAVSFGGSSEEVVAPVDTPVVASTQVVGLPRAPGLEPAPAATPSAATSTTPATPAAAPTTDEQADVEYLNSNRVWVVSNIKSEKYKALISAIEEGSIKDIANHDYFAVKGQATNSNALKAIDFMWLAYGSNQEGNQSKILKKYGKKSEINVYELMDELSRRLPAEAEQNKSSRPQR